jgi:hypothetical protein
MTDSKKLKVSKDQGEFIEAIKGGSTTDTPASGRLAGTATTFTDRAPVEGTFVGATKLTGVTYDGTSAKS